MGRVHSRAGVGMRGKPRSAASLLAALVFTMPVAVKADDSRPAIVERFASELERLYVYADRGHAAAVRIRARSAEHAYDALGDQAFARALTADAVGVLHDKHVHFFYNQYVLPPENDPAAPLSGAERKAARERAARGNFGFAGVRMLRGDIGYVDLRGFPAPEYTAPTMARAMRSIAGARAIIIDERLNNGGYPPTVALLASYFFPKGSRVHLDDLSLRIGGVKKIDSIYTSDVAAPRFPKVPLYVLTSGATFSAGELFAYDMQALKRATVVGRSTHGGANGGVEHRFSKHFSAFIPIGTSVNPITHTNWEGVGVQPDITTTLDDTFKVGYLAALRATLDSTSSDERSALIEWIDSVERTDAPALAQQLHVLFIKPYAKRWSVHA